MAEFDWNNFEDAPSGPAQASNEAFNFDQFEDAETPNQAMSVRDERNPDISWLSRFISKNFSNSPEAALAYIKQEYPGLDVALSNGEVVAKRPGEETYTRMDPSSLEFSDISDLGDTVASGVASQLGLVGGATVGAMAGAPAAGVGAIPGAMAGGIAGAGAASSATEYLRQRLGKALGIPQEVSGGDVALAGALGSAGVGALGTGPLKGLAKSGETQGLVRAAWNKGIPKLSGALTGAGEDVLRLYTNPATRESVEGLASGGKTQFTDDLVTRVSTALNKEKSEIGSRLRSEIDNAGDMVDMSSAKQPFLAQIDELTQVFERVPTPENEAALNSAKNSYMTLFGTSRNVAGPANQAGEKVMSTIPDAMLPSDAWRMQQQLKDVGDLRKISGGVNARYASQATADEKALSDSALGSYRAVGDELGRVTGGRSPELKAQYSQLADIQDALSPLKGNTQSAYSAFNNLDGSGKVAFKEALENLGKRSGDDFGKEATMLQAADYFGSNAWMPRSAKGTTSTSRTLTGSGLGGGAGFLLGGYPGMLVGGAAGSVATSPQGLKYGIKLTDPLRQGTNALGRVYNPNAAIMRETLVKSPWMNME